MIFNLPVRRLVLCIGFYLIFSPAVVSAGSVDGLEPVSPYVSQVLQRADRALAAGGGGNLEEDTREAWLRVIDEAVGSAVDTDITIEKQQQNLTEYTACFYIDLALIEAKMSEVHQEMLNALQIDDGARISKLRDLYKFLHDRKKHVIKGARDPEYEDDSWGRLFSFDVPEQKYCCSNNLQCVPAAADQTCDRGSFFTKRSCQQSGCEGGEVTPEGKTCPFTTDYGPPTSAGYGCGLEILQRYTAHQSTRKEYEALETLVSERRNFFNKIDPLLMTLFTEEERQQILQAINNTNHKTRYGCGGIEGDGESGDDSWLEEAGIVERRSPFHLTTLDDIKILRIFTGIKNQQVGNGREQAVYLKKDEEEAKTNFLFRGIAGYFRDLFTEWNLSQAQQDSRGYARFTEPRFFVQEAFEPLRKANRELAELVTNMEKGLRRFAIDFSYYIRRSCVYRVCNNTLDRALKILFKDECFPYVSGEYLESDDNTQACKQAAEVETN